MIVLVKIYIDVCTKTKVVQQKKSAAKHKNSVTISFSNQKVDVAETLVAKDLVIEFFIRSQIATEISMLNLLIRSLAGWSPVIVNQNW